jgi:beta-phosphoglucomutase-like phosphatase (HAD superfamily)
MLLRAARRAGWATAVVTSNAETITRAWLAHNHLDPLVDFVVDGATGGRGKPYPDPYLRALELTGACAANSIAVEDSSTGVRAAVSASLPTHVLRLHDGHDLSADDASLIPSIAGWMTSLEDLVPLLQDRPTEP